MVAVSITDSELLHGSPISRDFAKKCKANWFCKLKQWKVDARRKQLIFQWKGASVDDEENGRRLQSLLEKLTDQKAWRIDSDDDVDNDEKTWSASSPTSVLKSKGSVSEDCFCCSKPMTEEEEEVFDDAFDDWDGFRDALNFFENDNDETPRLETDDLGQEEDPNPNTNQRRDQFIFPKDNNKSKPEAPPEKTVHRSSKKKSTKSEKQEVDEECPICCELMDATDLNHKPCPCGFQICLFCYNTICQNEARCPVCRKEYNQTSNNSSQVTYQQRGRDPIPLSPSFGGLDRA